MAQADGGRANVSGPLEPEKCHSEISLWISSWLESDGVDPKRFPKVLDHRNRMAQRAAVQRVLPLHA